MMQKHLFFILIAVLFLNSGINAQSKEKMRMDSVDLLKMYEFEDELEEIAETITESEFERERLNATHQLIPRLVQALRTPYSFDYPFYNLNNISILQSPDNKFRILTWTVQFDNMSSRYFGTIQMNTEDGALKMFPLVDARDSLERHAQEVLPVNRWYGALYYNIKHYKHQGRDYYVLFGFVGHDMLSQMKLLEILHFEDGKPVFGAPLVQSKYNQSEILNRFFIEYTRDAFATLNYNTDFGLIIFDHLVPPDPQYEGMYFTYIPDGSYEGYKFKDGKFKYVEYAFPQQEGAFDNPPIPHPRFETPNKRDMPDFR